MSGATVTKPVTIDDAAYTASSVAEPDTGEAVYDSDTPYGVGDLVISTSTHRIYKSLQTPNAGNPLPVAPATATDYWRDVGPTNKWAVFDLFSSISTTGASPLSITLTPGARVTALGATGIVADVVDLSMVVDGDEIWSASVDLRRRTVTTWLEWLITPFESTPDIFIQDIPPIIGGELTITFTRSAGDVSVKQMVLGRAITIGDPQIGANSDVEDFSRVDRDDFGDLTLIPRRTIPKVSMVVVANRELGRTIRDTRNDLHAQPAMWTGLPDLSDGFGAPLFIIGIYRRWQLELGEADLITQTIDLEGL